MSGGINFHEKMPDVQNFVLSRAEESQLRREPAVSPEVILKSVRSGETKGRLFGKRKWVRLVVEIKRGDETKTESVELNVRDVARRLGLTGKLERRMLVQTINELSSRAFGAISFDDLEEGLAKNHRELTIRNSLNVLHRTILDIYGHRAAPMTPEEQELLIGLTKRLPFGRSDHITVSDKHFYISNGEDGLSVKYIEGQSISKPRAGSRYQVKADTIDLRTNERVKVETLYYPQKVYSMDIDMGRVKKDLNLDGILKSTAEEIYQSESGVFFDPEEAVMRSFSVTQELSGDKIRFNFRIRDDSDQEITGFKEMKLTDLSPRIGVDVQVIKDAYVHSRRTRGSSFQKELIIRQNLKNMRVPISKEALEEMLDYDLSTTTVKTLNIDGKEYVFQVSKENLQLVLSEKVLKPEQEGIKLEISHIDLATGKLGMEQKYIYSYRLIKFPK